MTVWILLVSMYISIFWSSLRIPLQWNCKIFRVYWLAWLIVNVGLGDDGGIAGKAICDGGTRCKRQSSAIYCDAGDLH